MHLPPKTHCSLLSVVEVQIQSRIVGFVNGIPHAENKSLLLAVRMALNGNRSAVFNYQCYLLEALY